MHCQDHFKVLVATSKAVVPKVESHNPPPWEALGNALSRDREKEKAAAQSLGLPERLVFDLPLAALVYGEGGEHPVGIPKPQNMFTT